MKNRGSVQVIEMAFVLPVAIGVVLSLFYLAYAMFLHAHTQNLVRSALNEIENHIGKSSMYWQIKGEYIDDQSLAECQMGLLRSLNKSAVVPGLKMDAACSVTGKLRQPVAHVHVEASYFGKRIFVLDKSQDVYRPAEFAETVDFGHTVEKDFEELKAIYDAVF